MVLAHNAGHVHAPGTLLDRNAAVGTVFGVLGDPLGRRGVSLSGHEMRDVHLN